jgi:glutamate decarboxylase
MNGTHEAKPLNRADEVEHVSGYPGFIVRATLIRWQLIDAVKALIIPFIRDADEAVPSRAAGELLPKKQGVVKNALVDARKPEDLVRELALSLPKGEGRGEEGLLETIKDVLKYSVNTWDQGFMDKLYASTNPVRLAACYCDCPV